MSTTLTLIIREGDTVWRKPIVLGRVTIGRSNASDFILRGETVSWDHAVIEVRDECIWITDQGSPGGTYVNGKRITAPALVGELDVLKIGQHILALSVRPDESQPTTARMPAAPPSAPPGPRTPTVPPPSLSSSSALGSAPSLAPLTPHPVRTPPMPSVSPSVPPASVRPPPITLPPPSVVPPPPSGRISSRPAPIISPPGKLPSVRPPPARPSAPPSAPITERMLAAPKVPSPDDSSPPSRS